MALIELNNINQFKSIILKKDKINIYKRNEISLTKIKDITTNNKNNANRL